MIFLVYAKMQSIQAETCNCRRAKITRNWFFRSILLHGVEYFGLKLSIKLFKITIFCSFSLIWWPYYIEISPKHASVYLGQFFHIRAGPFSNPGNGAVLYFSENIELNCCRKLFSFVVCQQKIWNEQLTTKTCWFSCFFISFSFFWSRSSFRIKSVSKLELNPV